MDHSLPLDRLSKWERLGLAAFLGLVLVFGFLVELRSAFLQRRMGDLTVYLRAAWAVRTGQDIYAITDHNGWHYHYPPLFAILLVPLADPPALADHSGMLPYPVTVALWYALNVLCLFLAVHGLAGAMERTAADPAAPTQPRSCRRWWALRMLPILVCLPPIGHTLMRGQVNILVLALVCGMAAALLRGRHWQAGWWLAGAICLKVIPAFLLLYPLWRRDLRCLSGCALGLIVGLGIIPAAVFGPTRTVAYYRQWTDVLALPALAQGTNQSRVKELLDVTATRNQSLQATIHNTLHLDRATRPAAAAPAVRRAHWLFGGALTVLTLVLAGWRRAESGPDRILFLGALVLIMLLLAPVCHPHYFCLAVPAVMGLLAAAWQRTGSLRLGREIQLLLVLNVAGNTLPLLTECRILCDLGMSMYTALLLWLAVVICLWRRRHGPGQATSALPAEPRLAA